MKQTKVTEINQDIDNLTSVSITEETETEKLQREIKEAEAKLKELKAAAKPKKALKGEPVRFKNQKNEVIQGYGVLYYVVNVNGKLHYKEASQVTKITVEEL